LRDAVGSSLREEAVVIRSGSISLEALYAPNDGAAAVLCAHPHPLMGGSMRDVVTEAVVAAFFRAGYSTLRFNFRGVGGSEGTYDDGVGEQNDILAAADLLCRKGKSDVALAGYSFGAWVCANVLEKETFFSKVVFVSPPLDFMAFPSSSPRVHLMTYGGEDPFCSAGSIRCYAKKCRSVLECITGADHFYTGKIVQLMDNLEEYLTLK